MFGYLFVLQFIGVYSKTCYYSFYSYSSSLRSKYCIYGCCSSYSSNPCCSSSYSSYDYDISYSVSKTISMRAQRGMQGQVLSQQPVAYITTPGSNAPSTYPQTAFPPTFGSNGNMMGSTEQLNVIPTSNGNTAYPPSTGNTAYPPSYDNLAHDNMKGSESSMNACT
ncbi:uncharacterized protein [Mytilus edulis]|uniref:uncharacterized protein isoform X2 n=1 Tax=Mytilus edulis TaxID=6550 RepID=UPI0039EEB34F